MARGMITTAFAFVTMSGSKGVREIKKAKKYHRQVTFS
eukprot:CAMPEP_0194712052 /NCGR_PEP_ID=MMETSP0296-20130528/4270_1 /TAXON_ID=39354 /ORGANISM="Heterosigma akashiwo, Strain CCMP2393" /LENGTH=37 /DNA_ID= /DNA_START= /DNA_END= /DNA_ORIENTATION=